MAIKKGTLDELLSGRDPKEVFSKDGLFDELKKALAERVLNAELDDHLDGHAAAGKANHRNGYSKKTVLTGSDKLDLRSRRHVPVRNSRWSLRNATREPGITGETITGSL